MVKRVFGSRASEARAPTHVSARTTFQVSEDIMPIAELKARLSDTVRTLEVRGRPLVITLNGKPAAVLMSAKEFDRIRYREQVMNAIGEGLADDAAGRTISDEELGRRIERRYRVPRKGRSER